MKRFWRITSILIAALMLLSVFVSCGSGSQTPEEVMANMTDKEKADYLSEKNDEYYAKGATVDMTLSAVISGSLVGVNMSGDYSATIVNTIVINDNGDISSMSVENTESNVTAAGETQTEKYSVTEGFYDGIMYYAKVPENKDESNTVRLKSNCTSAQYGDYLKEKSGEKPDFNLTKDCQTVTVKKSEDGSQWILTFSDLAEGSTVTEQWGEMMGELPVDMRVRGFKAVLYVDVNTLALTYSRIDVVISADDANYSLELRLSVQSTFSLPDKDTVLIPENIDSYEEAGDLISAYYATEDLQKLVYSKDASATLAISVKLNQVVGNSTTALSTYKETDRLNYAEIDNKFKYHIVADISSTGSEDSQIIIKNNGAKQTILQNGSPYSTTTQLKFEARSFIATTLKAYNLILDKVTGIETSELANGDRRIQLDLFMDEEIYNSFASIGFDTNKLIGTKYNMVVVTDKDGNIISASLQIEGSCVIENVKYQYIQLAKLTDISTADKDLLAE